MPDWRRQCDACEVTGGAGVQLGCGHSFHNSCLPLEGGRTSLKCAICQSHLEEGIRENVAAFLESLQRPPAGTSAGENKDIEENIDINIDRIDNDSDDDAEATVA